MADIKDKDLVGKDMKNYQTAQNQLLELHNQQKQNIAAQKIEEMANSNQNNVMAQAAGLALSGQPAQLNQQTQATLGKYGMKKPMSVSKTQTQRTVTRQNIVINNNTVNNTTTYTGGGAGPVQGRSVSIKPNDDVIKFKTWMGNAFAKQEQEASLRRRDYDKRDRELTRSHGRILKRLESMAQEFGDKMDPRRIGSTWTNQLKILGAIYGFHKLVTNWNKILRIVGGIESRVTKFLKWMGVGDNKNFAESGLYKSLLGIFGAKEGETLKDAFKEFFVGDEGVFTYLLDKFKLIMKLRADAVKEVQFPNLDDNDNLGDVLRGFGTYLGDILACLLNGRKGASQVISRNMEKEAMNSLNKDNAAALNMSYDTIYSNNNASSTNQANDSKYFSKDDKKTLENTLTGDASILYRDKQGRYSGGIEKSDVDYDNNLTNNTVAGIKLSRSILHQIIESRSHNPGEAMKYKAMPAAITTGLKKLRETAEKNGTILVDPYFLSSFISYIGGSDEDYSSISEFNKKLRKKYKFVRDARSGEEKYRDGENSTDYTLRLVPESDSRDMVKPAGNQSGLLEFAELTPEIFDTLNKYIGRTIGVENYNPDLLDKEALEKLNNKLLSKYGKGSTESDYNNYKTKIERANRAEEYEEKQLQDFENSRHLRASDGANYLGEAARSGFGEAVKVFKKMKDNLDGYNPMMWDNAEGKSENNAGKRNKNPGNRHYDSSDKWASGKDGDYSVYTNLADGYAGNAFLLGKYMTGDDKYHTWSYSTNRHNPPTVREILEEWCPPNGKGNTREGVEKYVQEIASFIGVTPETQLPLTLDNLFYLEMAKSRRDSGIVDKDAGVKGVKMAWDELVSQGIADENAYSDDYEVTGGLGEVAGAVATDVSNVAQGAYNAVTGAFTQEQDLPTTTTAPSSVSTTSSTSGKPQYENYVELRPESNPVQDQVNKYLSPSSFSFNAFGMNVSNSTTTPTAPGYSATNAPNYYTTGSKTEVGGVSNFESATLISDNTDTSNPKQTINISQFSYVPEKIPAEMLWNPSVLMPRFEKEVKDEEIKINNLLNKIGVVLDDDIEYSKRNLLATGTIVDAVNNITASEKKVLNNVDITYNRKSSSDWFYSGFGPLM